MSEGYKISFSPQVIVAEMAPGVYEAVVYAKNSVCAFF